MYKYLLLDVMLSGSLFDSFQKFQENNRTVKIGNFDHFYSKL